MKSSIFKSSVFLPIAAVVFVLIAGVTSSVNAQQRDPFKKAGWATKKDAPVGKSGTGSSGATVKVPATPVSYAPPPIEARIDYYKRLRESAATSGAPLPKVTSVLTIGEMSLVGVFKTPRGYAAMIEATPIKLSYTIYPGEKFFDGQLVAIEENRLVFRKVTKTGEGQFVASVENKPLRQFTMRAKAEGTAPAGESEKAAETATTSASAAGTNGTNANSSNGTNANNAPANAGQAPQQPPVMTASTTAPTTKSSKPAGNPFLSPLDEMNSLPDKSKAQDKNKKPAAKPVKVAKNDGK
jgi:hypothetical protein